MSRLSDAKAPSFTRLRVSVEFIPGMDLVQCRVSTPTSNDGAGSKKIFRSSVSLIPHCNRKTESQPYCRGNDAPFSRPDNLNRNFVSYKTLDQFFSPTKLRKEVHSMQKIGNHDRLDLARTDTLHGIGAVPDTMEKAEDAESDWIFNGDFKNLKSEKSPKSGKQKKLLQVQRLGNFRNRWPVEFFNTRPFDLQAENQPYKQSSLRTTELEEFLKAGNQQSSLRTTELEEFIKAGNQPYKQSSLTTIEIEEFLNTDQHYTLDRQLKSRHIQLIAISATIGTGIFLPPPIHGPLSLLIPFTVIGLIAWPFMYALGELLTHFPLGIGNSWIEDLNLYQKLQQFVIQSGAAFSMLQIASSVADRGSLAVGFFTCLFVISRLAVCYILYSTILKAISWSISGIRLLIQTFKGSYINRLPGHRSSRSRSHAGQALILSLLLCTTPVTATAPYFSTNPSPCSSFLLALTIESGKLFSLFTTPQPPFPRSIPAPTLLIALLLTTSLTTILYTLLRHNTSTKYLLCTSVCLALLLGSVSAVDIPDLVFRYLFFGVGFGLMISALESVVKLVRFWRDRTLEMKVEMEVEKRGYVVGTKDMEAGRELSSLD